jgi:hypothetical protein
MIKNIIVDENKPNDIKFLLSFYSIKANNRFSKSIRSLKMTNTTLYVHIRVFINKGILHSLIWVIVWITINIGADIINIYILHKNMIYNHE